MANYAENLTSRANCRRTTRTRRRHVDHGSSCRCGTLIREGGLRRGASIRRAEGPHGSRVRLLVGAGKTAIRLGGRLLVSYLPPTWPVEACEGCAQKVRIFVVRAVISPRTSIRRSTGPVAAHVCAVRISAFMAVAHHSQAWPSRSRSLPVLSWYVCRSASFHSGWYVPPLTFTPRVQPAARISVQLRKL